MAYLRNVADKCNTFGCKGRASVELRNRFNSVYGKFCAKCGTKRLKALQRMEDKDENDQRKERK